MTLPPLAAREGIPDDMAYLRARYPRPEWRQHANFGELSAFWLHVHDSLRGHGAELGRLTTAFREGRLDPASFQRAFVPRLNQFLQHLNGHHQIEDHAYFPKFRTLDMRMVAGFDLLEADHRLIHEALLASARSGQALLTALGGGSDAARSAADSYAGDADHLLALLVRHLADEEDLVLPAMLHHGERSVG
jgi:hemerythrin-like domain-containing protein